MGGACTRSDTPKAAFAIQTLSVLTNALYISYIPDEVCNAFRNTQNEHEQC